MDTYREELEQVPPPSKNQYLGVRTQDAYEASPVSSSRAEVRQERKAAQTKMDTYREELEQVPPPSKNQYLGVRTQDAYANPFLVVHPQTVTLTIIYRDQDPNGFSGGGLLRPPKARKQEIDIRPDDLPLSRAGCSFARRMALWHLSGWWP